MKFALASGALFAAAALLWHPVHAQPKPVVQAPADQQAQPGRRPPQFFQFPNAATAVGSIRTLTCLISTGTNHVSIVPDWGNPVDYGMKLTWPGHRGNDWTWVPAGLAVHMTFKKSVKPAPMIEPGQCAFKNEGTATSPADEIVFPRARDSWEYKSVDGRPLLVPMGSHVEDLLTSGRRLTLEVILTEYPQGSGERVWYAPGPPQPAG